MKKKIFGVLAAAGICISATGDQSFDRDPNNDIEEWLEDIDVRYVSLDTVQVFRPPFPPSLKHGAVESDQKIGLRAERRGWLVNAIPPLNDLTPVVDYLVPPASNSWITLNKFNRPFFGQQQEIEGRQRINVYYLHYDPIGNNARIANTVAKIAFQKEIIGIIFTGDSDENFVRGNTLDATSDYSLVPYEKPSNSDFRRQGSLDGHPSVDFIQISPDRTTLLIGVACKSFHMDNIRVITRY